MARYVPGALREHAAHLYVMARRVEFLYPAMGTVFGAVVTRGVIVALVGFKDLHPVVLWYPNEAEVAFLHLLGAALGGLCGWQFGEVQAARLRLEAEAALCQAQVEENTRALQAAGAGSTQAAAR